MRTIGNLLWIVLAGVWLALGYAVAGVLLCITLVGVPFGIQAFKLAGLALWPFGRTVVPDGGEGGCLQLGANVVWLVLFGWELFLVSVVSGLLLCVTIIGIPFGIQAFKLSVLALWPFGRTIVTTEQAEALGLSGTSIGLPPPSDPNTMG